MENQGLILDNLRLFGKDALPVIAGLMLIALLILLLSSAVLGDGQKDGREDFVNKLKEKEKKLKEKEEKLNKIQEQLKGMR